MILIQTNIQSVALLTSLKALMSPFQVSFMPPQDNAAVTASNHTPVYILDEPEIDMLSHVPPNAILICFGTAEEKFLEQELPVKKSFFVEKPFRVESLITLLKKVVKNSIQFGRFILDYDGRMLRDIHQNKTLSLTEKEATLLLTLFQRQGQEVSRENLLLHVWGYKSDLETHTLETHLSRLKKKIMDTFDIFLILNKSEGYFLSDAL